MLQIRKIDEDTFEITRERLFELLKDENRLYALEMFGFLLPEQTQNAVTAYLEYYEAESIEDLVRSRMSRMCRRQEFREFQESQKLEESNKEKIQ